PTDRRGRAQWTDRGWPASVRLAGREALRLSGPPIGVLQMDKVLKRIGQIVPSSNTTMETEIPAILRAREAAGIGSETFTFHSSRMRMKKVTKEELAAMDRDSIRCAAELADSPVDVVGYACLA